MTTVSIHLTTNDLLKGVEQLNGADLDEFVQQVLHIRAKRFSNNLAKEEAKLIEQINDSSLSKEDYQQLLLLSKKSEASNLTAIELELYQSLSNKMEILNVKRMAALTQLANLRGTSLNEIMKQLGLFNMDE